MAWIRVIHENEATGRLKTHYDRAIQRAGRVWNIVKIMSLNPSLIRTSIEGLYVTIMHGESRLSRAHREMIATVVSRANRCHY